VPCRSKSCGSHGFLCRPRRPPRYSIHSWGICLQGQKFSRHAWKLKESAMWWCKDKKEDGRVRGRGWPWSVVQRVRPPGFCRGQLTHHAMGCRALLRSNTRQTNLSDATRDPSSRLTLAPCCPFHGQGTWYSRARSLEHEVLRVSPSPTNDLPSED
jgi:hypothetical protein